MQQNGSVPRIELQGVCFYSFNKQISSLVKYHYTDPQFALMMEAVNTFETLV
jgi:hypothetical protein